MDSEGFHKLGWGLGGGVLGKVRGGKKGVKGKMLVGGKTRLGETGPQRYNKKLLNLPTEKKPPYTSGTRPGGGGGKMTVDTESI